MKAYLSLIRIDLKLAFRQKVVIFFNLLMPLALFMIFAEINRTERSGGIGDVVTMVSVIGILGTGLFGAGMRAAQEREANVLRRYKVAPITPLPLLVASMVTGLAVYMPFVVLMLTVAHVRYGMNVPSNLVSVLVFIALGVTAIRSIGLIVGAVVNSTQESGILVQVLYMSMLFLSGATFPTQMFPAWLLKVSRFVPAAYIVNGLQSILLRHETLWTNWPGAAALLLTTAVGLLLSVKLFRWEKEEKLRPAAKLWLLAVLLPFALPGLWHLYTGA